MQVGDIITLAGDPITREVAFVSSPNRVIVKYDGGLLICCDQFPDGTWGLSGQPASPGEQAFIQGNMPDVDTTSVIVTKDPS